MANGLYRRPNSPHWWYRFKVGGRVFRGSTGTTQEREARVVLGEEREKAGEEAKRARRRGGPPLTFSDACKLYFDEVGQHHAGAAKTAWSLQWLQTEVGPDRRLDEIDGRLVMQVVAKRRGEPRRLGGKLAHSTVNRSITEPLRKVLLHAQRVHNAEVTRIDWKQYMLKEPAERVRELKVEEERALFEACRGDYAPIIRFALLTGCRLSECVGLRWADVDFGNRAIVIRGKGGTVEPIPMPPAVREILWELRGHHREAVFTYLVQKARGSRQVGTRAPITLSGLSTAWRRLKAKMGLKDYRFHDNRHTAATRILRNGGNLVVVNKLLRHSRIDTTARYSHVNADDIAVAMQTAAEVAAESQRSYGEGAHSEHTGADRSENGRIF